MSNLRGANQAGRPLLTPPLLELDVERTKELGITFALVASNNDADVVTSPKRAFEGPVTTNANERLGPIVKRNKKLGDRWEVLVHLGDMGFKFLEA